MQQRKKKLKGQAENLKSVLDAFNKFHLSAVSSKILIKTSSITEMYCKSYKNSFLIVL